MFASGCTPTSARMVALIVERGSICRHEAAWSAWRASCSSAFLFFSPGRFYPFCLLSKRRGSAFSRYGNTYRYYATSVAEPPKSNMKSRECERWNSPARCFCAAPNSFDFLSAGAVARRRYSVRRSLKILAGINRCSVICDSAIKSRRASR